MKRCSKRRWNFYPSFRCSSLFCSLPSRYFDFDNLCAHLVHHFDFDNVCARLMHHFNLDNVRAHLVHHFDNSSAHLVHHFDFGNVCAQATPMKLKNIRTDRSKCEKRSNPKQKHEFQRHIKTVEHDANVQVFHSIKTQKLPNPNRIRFFRCLYCETCSCDGRKKSKHVFVDDHVM